MPKLNPRSFRQKSTEFLIYLSRGSTSVRISIRTTFLECEIQVVEARLDEAQKIFDIDREQYEEYIGPFAFVLAVLQLLCLGCPSP